MAAAATGSSLSGTGELVRLYLRLDRVRLPSWLLVVVGLVLASAASVSSLYGTPEEIARYVALIGTSSNMTAVNSALNGPGFGFDRPDVGVVLVNEAAIWGAVAMSLMCIFVMAAHTRGEEDAQRIEVVRSRMVGRNAPLAAAALVVVGAAVLAGTAVLVGLLAMGYGVVGAVALVMAYVATGLLFGALTAAAAQVTNTARATLGAGVGALGVAYLVRAVGDMGDGTLSWMSPLGWVHRVRPFAGEQWWVLGLSFATTAVLAAASMVISARRDLGAGLVPRRPGPRHAGAVTRTRVGLLARLQTGSILGWSIGLFVLGLAYGSVASDIEAMFVDNPDLERFIPSGPSPTDAYLAYTLSLSALMVAGAGIASVLRLRHEESSGRLELVLSRSVSRIAWAGDHLVVAAAGAGIALLASGLGTGVGVAVALGDSGQVLRMVAAALATLPAPLVLIGVAMACVGLVPRAALVSWVALALVVTVALFADLFSLPGWVRSLSPLHHLAAVPAADFDPWAAIGVTLVGLLIAAVGLVGLRRRDVPAL